MKPADAPTELARLQARNQELEAEKARLQAQADALRGEMGRLQAQLVLKEGWRPSYGRPCWNWPSSSGNSSARRARSSRRRRKPNWPKWAPISRNNSSAIRLPVRTCWRRKPTTHPSQQDPPRRKRRRRHPLPEHLERQTVVLEPERLVPCEQCGRTPGCIGEEVSEELDYVPAKVVVRRTVRPKYACRCGGGGVQIAPLPPRLLPQSKLGLALAVYLLLARFDDHVAYYTLERIFLERHGVVLPRQQMVQWVAHIAFLLQPLYRLMFEEMKQGAYLQVDETPVKVMDPEVKGKCARGYLWFYAVPGGDVFLDFQGTRGRAAPHAQLANFRGTIQTRRLRGVRLPQESGGRLGAHWMRGPLAPQVPPRPQRWRPAGNLVHWPVSTVVPPGTGGQATDTGPTSSDPPERGRPDLGSAQGTGASAAAPTAAQEQSGQSGELPRQRIRGAHRLPQVGPLPDRQQPRGKLDSSSCCRSSPLALHWPP